MSEHTGIDKCIAGADRAITTMQRWHERVIAQKRVVGGHMAAPDELLLCADAVQCAADHLAEKGERRVSVPKFSPPPPQSEGIGVDRVFNTGDNAEYMEYLGKYISDVKSKFAEITPS